MKILNLVFTEKEFKNLLKIKLIDPADRCHHSWVEFIMRIARYYDKHKLKVEDEN